mmetsp:Transcript_30056/g.50882  ORF Transcript_30056/g.50882 Transcript_30056/m.50882 type:complete len:110 (-) Transcript_30056:163-492(-)|eukprot:jgi/Bigna1/83887/fgenesh1_pg.117_\
MIQGKGEFEFRIRTKPLERQDFIRENIDPDTKEVTRMSMQPAPEHVMQYALALQLGRRDVLSKCGWTRGESDSTHVGEEEMELFETGSQGQRHRRFGCANVGGPACLLL